METTDYSKFKIVNSNRRITERHVTMLMKSIKENGYFKSKPITVNLNHEVSDGQHRLEACKRLGIPVLYEVDNVDVNKSMIVLNNSQNNWRLGEFINHYAALGSKCYIDLRDFLIKENFKGTSNAIYIFTGVTGGCSRQIRVGSELSRNKRFEITKDLITFIKPHFQYTLSANFVRAIVRFLNDDTTTQKHIDKLKHNVFSLIPCASVEQYYIQLNRLSKKTTKNK